MLKLEHFGIKNAMIPTVSRAFATINRCIEKINSKKELVTLTDKLNIPKKSLINLKKEYTDCFTSSLMSAELNSVFRLTEFCTNALYLSPLFKLNQTLSELYRQLLIYKRESKRQSRIIAVINKLIEDIDYTPEELQKIEKDTHTEIVLSVNNKHLLVTLNFKDVIINVFDRQGRFEVPVEKASVLIVYDVALIISCIKSKVFNRATLPYSDDLLYERMFYSSPQNLFGADKVSLYGRTEPEEHPFLLNRTEIRNKNEYIQQGWTTGCLGTYESYVKKGIEKFDLRTLISCLRNWLQTYPVNSVSPYNNINKMYIGMPKKYGQLALRLGRNAEQCRKQLLKKNLDIKYCDKIECQIRDSCSPYQSWTEWEAIKKETEENIANDTNTN